jgi:hypothetical protein
VDGERLRLGEGPREQRARPAIDALFRSAAAAFGRRLIGVVLTGMLRDGTEGLRAVRDAGGITIVQNPESAQAAGMPRSAMEGLGVDYCLDLPEIGPLLELLVRRAGAYKEGVLETGVASALRLMKDRATLLAKLYAQSRNNPKTSAFLASEIAALDRELALVLLAGGQGWAQEVSPQDLPDPIADELPYREGEPPPRHYRLERRILKGPVIFGGLLLGGSLLAGAAVAASSGFRDVSGVMLVPVLGPFLRAGLIGACGATTASVSTPGDCYSEQTSTLLFFDSVIQSLGAAVFLAGIIGARKVWVRENAPMIVAPTFSGRGVSLVGTF